MRETRYESVDTWITPIGGVTLDSVRSFNVMRQVLAPASESGVTVASCSDAFAANLDQVECDIPKAKLQLCRIGEPVAIARMSSIRGAIPPVYFAHLWEMMRRPESPLSFAEEGNVSFVRDNVGTVSLVTFWWEGGWHINAHSARSRYELQRGTVLVSN